MMIKGKCRICNDVAGERFCVFCSRLIDGGIDVLQADNARYIDALTDARKAFELLFETLPPKKGGNVAAESVRRINEVLNGAPDA